MGRGMQSPALPASGPVWQYRVNGPEFRKTLFGILFSTSGSFWRIRIAVRGGSATSACASLIFNGLRLLLVVVLLFQWSTIVSNSDTCVGFKEVRRDNRAAGTNDDAHGRSDQTDRNRIRTRAGDTDQRITGEGG